MEPATKSQVIGGINLPTIPDLHMYAADECRSSAFKDYIVKGMIYRGDVSCIFGPPGAGKSLLAPYIGYKVSRGEPVFGRRTKPIPVLYVAAEDSLGMNRRVVALRKRMGGGAPFFVTSAVSDLYREPDEGEFSEIFILSENARRKGVSLIIIDTLAMAFPGLEENDSKSMGRLVSQAERLAAYTGAAVLLVHHDTKSEGGTPRGHSILNARLDMAMHVRRQSNGLVEGRFTKNRNGSCDRSITFRVGVEYVDIDADGDQITAPILEELSGDTPSPVTLLSTAEGAALRIFKEMSSSGSVRRQDWITACTANNLVSNAIQHTSQQRSARRVVDSIREKGLIELDGEYIVDGIGGIHGGEY